MGTRRLLKEGVLIKAKSGRKLNAFLCSDILVLTDESVKNLYRMVRDSHSYLIFDAEIYLLAAHPSRSCESEGLWLERCVICNCR